MIKLVDLNKPRQNTILDMEVGDVAKIVRSRDNYLDGSIVICLKHHDHGKQVFTLVTSMPDNLNYCGPWKMDSDILIEKIVGKITLELS